MTSADFDRSDGALNPSGVRFGSSEIYAVLESIFSEQILDFLCVGQQRASDVTERVVLFLKMTPAHTGKLGDVEPEIRRQITKNLSRRHVPAFMFEVQAIPYNANGKRLEIPVKKILCQGKEGLRKSNFTAVEAQILNRYEKFYNIEDAGEKWW